jgi:hypothetical protein
LPVGYVLKSIVAVDRNLATESLRIMADLAPPEVTITLGAAPGTSWARVSGRVTNVATRAAERGGQFRGGANSSLRPTAVLLISKEFSEHWFAPLGPDGAFEFPRVLPHSYELRVFPDSAVTPALKLNVTPSANMTNLQIVAPDVKTIPCPNC